MQIWHSLGHFGPFAFTTSAAQCQQSQQRRHSLPFPLALRHLWSSSHQSWLIALDHLLALYSLFNQWLSAFHRGLETCPRKWQIAPLILPGCWCWCCLCSESVPRQCLLCPLIHSVPFFRPALFFLFACLAGFLCLCSLAGTARNFLHMFTAWIFYGLKCFQLESFALPVLLLLLLMLCASCTLQKYKDAHKFIRLVSCSSTDIVGCESKAKSKCCSSSCPA